MQRRLAAWRADNSTLLQTRSGRAKLSLMPNPFDFGDVAVCERCATTMPLSEAHMIRRIIYDDANPNAADATRTKYYLCPRCFQSVQQKNQWIGIRHWLLLGGAGLVGLILLMCAVLYANRLR